MKKNLTIIVCCMLLSVISGNAQNVSSSREMPHNIGNGYGILGQSFLAQNVCGLNYVYASQLTETRTQSLSFNTNGSGLPTTLNISGIPANFCVVKAYLYWGSSYSEASAPTVEAFVTNPASDTATLAADLLGTTIATCWIGSNGTATYRADISSTITGNGNYTVDLKGFTNASAEVDGVNMIVIYSTPATYSGSISLWDGEIVSNTILAPQVLSGINVCASSTTASAFGIMDEIQSDAHGNSNTDEFNGSTASFTNNYDNFNVMATSVTNGQVTTSFAPYINNSNSSDCYSWLMAGLYWQNTTCTTCIIPSPLSATPTNTSPSCGNSNGSIAVNASGGQTPYTYIWSPNVCSSATATGLSVGIYTVVVNDAACDRVSQTVVLTNSSGPALTVAPNNPPCYGSAASANVSATGGTPPYTYSWSPIAGTNATLTGIGVGTYTVVVTDNAGCQNIGMTTITQPTALSATTATADAQCLSAVGSSTVTVSGGTSPYSYLWSPSSQTNAVVTGLSEGSYTVNIVDNNGCTLNESVTIVSGSSISSVSLGIGAYHCAAEPATVKVGHVHGGTSPYTYLWAPGGQTTQIVTGLSPGTYSVTVTDANGCSNTAAGTVTAVTDYVAAHGLAIISAGDSTEISALLDNSSTSGSWTWSPSASVRNPNSNVTYAYPTVTTTYTVTDIAPCGTYTDTVTVFVTCPTITLHTNAQHYYCSGMEGSADVTVHGGVSPYTYSWAPGGQTTDIITGLTDGAYTVTVTDKYGCNAVGTCTVSTVSSTMSVDQFTVISAGDSAYLHTVTDVSSNDISWSWAPSASVTHPTASASYVNPTSTTTYTVTGTTPCGTLTDTVTVVVNCVNTYDEPICIVTVDPTTQRNEIIWGRTNSPPTGSYNVYKDSVNTYVLIDNQPLTAYSDYIDTSSRPLLGPNYYEISTVDACGESAKSPYHETMYLSVVSTAGTDVLSWNAYVGFTPARYVIFRGTSMNSLVRYDSVPSTSLAYTDLTPVTNDVYMIEAVNPSSPCIPTMSIRRRSPLTGPLGDSVEYAIITSLSGSVSNGFNTVLLGTQNIGNAVSNLNIYPNPSNGQITIEWSVVSGQSSVRINIYDELGQTVYNSTEAQTAGKNIKQLNLENLAAGVYTVRMQTNSGTTVKKVVIIKNK